MEGRYVASIQWEMNVYTGEIPELPIGMEMRNKWTRDARIIFPKLRKKKKKEEERRRRGEGRRRNWGGWEGDEEEEEKEIFFLFLSGKI